MTAFNSVSFIYEDFDRRLWVGTLLGGISCYDPATGGFDKFEYNERDTRGLKSQIACSIFQSADGTMWLGPGHDFNPRVQRLEMGNKRFSFYPIQNRIQTFLESRDGNTWIGTLNAGLIRLNRKTGITNRQPIFTNGQDYDFYEDVGCLYEDRQGLIWIGFSYNRALIVLTRLPVIKNAIFSIKTRRYITRITNRYHGRPFRPDLDIEYSGGHFSFR
ncbi:MAG: hypothetical protein IPN33_22340 [Saprospiraceae bacterium]|nr:hypothetical protein [Saprospiraceae bacterium]